MRACERGSLVPSNLRLSRPHTFRHQRGRQALALGARGAAHGRRREQERHGCVGMARAGGSIGVCLEKGFPPCRTFAKRRRCGLLGCTRAKLALRWDKLACVSVCERENGAERGATRPAAAPVVSARRQQRAKRKRNDFPPLPAAARAPHVPVYR